jgi:hypothetical protein
MLPIYHRQYDTKLILLTVPACMAAWSRGGLSGRVALIVNALGFAIVGDLSSAILLKVVPASNGGISERIVELAEVSPVPLALLAMGLFYLWLYIRRSPEPLTYIEVACNEPVLNEQEQIG